jgi:hypothetical protein
LHVFPFCFQGELVGQKRLEVVSDPEGPHYHAGMAALAEHAQYLFDLQRLCMATYEECHISTARELAQLKYKNDLLCGGTIPPSEQDWELKVAYRRLSEAEHA